MRDVSWEDKLGASATTSEFFECALAAIDVYIPHLNYQFKPNSSPQFSAACVAAIVDRNHFFVRVNRILCCKPKVKFRQAIDN